MRRSTLCSGVHIKSLVVNGDGSLAATKRGEGEPRHKFA
jgi:hypothetical protein